MALFFYHVIFSSYFITARIYYWIQRMGKSKFLFPSAFLCVELSVCAIVKQTECLELSVCATVKQTMFGVVSLCYSKTECLEQSVSATVKQTECLELSVCTIVKQTMFVAASLCYSKTSNVRSCTNYVRSCQSVL